MSLLQNCKNIDRMTAILPFLKLRFYSVINDVTTIHFFLQNTFFQSKQRLCSGLKLSTLRYNNSFRLQNASTDRQSMPIYQTSGAP